MRCRDLARSDMGVVAGREVVTRFSQQKKYGRQCWFIGRERARQHVNLLVHRWYKTPLCDSIKNAIPKKKRLSTRPEDRHERSRTQHRMLDGLQNSLPDRTRLQWHPAATRKFSVLSGCTRGDPCVGERRRESAFLVRNPRAMHRTGVGG